MSDLKSTKAWHIQNLIDVEDDCQVVMLADALELEQQRNELAAQVERLRSVVEEYHSENIACEEAINELVFMLNQPESAALAALKAQVERLRCLLESAIRGEEIIVGDAIVIVIDAELADEIEESLDESPKSALAALKAQWQAEAVRDFEAMLSSFPVTAEDWIEQRAQEAGDD